MGRIQKISEICKKKHFELLSKREFNQILRILLSAVLFFTLSLFCYAQKTFSLSKNIFPEISKNQQKKNIETFLLEQKIDFTEIQVTGSSENFCPDIYIKFSPKNQKTSQNEEEKSFLQKELLFCVTQDFFAQNLELFSEFLNFLKENPQNQITSLLLLPDMEKKILPPEKNSVSALSAFTQDIYENENLCAVIIRNEEIWGSSIEIAGSENLSPSWLSQLLKKSAWDAGKQVDFPPLQNFLHRLKLTPLNEEVDLFLKNQIPAASIGIFNKAEDLETLKNVSLNFSDFQSSNWISHYSLLKTPGGNLWTDEYFYIELYLIAVFFALFYIFFLPLIGSSKNKATLKDFFRIAYIFPVVVIFTALIFLVSSKIFSFTAQNKMLFFWLKILFTISIVLFFLCIQASKNFKFSFNASGFQLLVSATLNLIIFGAQDITLIFVFILEYLIVQSVKGTQAKIANTVALVALLIPFEYILAEAEIFSAAGKFSLFSGNTFLESLNLGMIFYPILVQCQRVFLLLHVVENDRKKINRKKIFQIVFGIFTFELLILLVYSAFSFILKPRFQTKNSDLPLIKELDYSDSKFELNEKEHNFPDFSVSYSSEKNFSLFTKTLSLSSEKNILRYEIFISGEKINPVLECNFDYDFSGKSSCKILLPDFPTDQINIVYTSNGKQKETVQITAFVQNDDLSIFKETVVFDLKEQN